jgi:hypothetical protein
VTDETEWTEFAVGHVACPGCGNHIPIPVLARATSDDDGRQIFETAPQMDDLWSHSWACQAAGGAT